jgi:hypothetical protein
MKRITLSMTLAALTALCAGASFARGGGGDDRGDDHGGRDHGSRHAPAPAVVIKMHRVAVPHHDPIKDQSHVVRDQRHIDLPKRDGAGAPIVTHAETRPPVQHAEMARNHGFVHGIEDQQRSEMEVGHHYWHTAGGVQYSHYYDGHAHWYGFYHGPTFYWTRYHANRWWWYDTAFARWVYWGDGFWWWPGPAGVAYVYADGNYYPYEQEGSVVTQKPELQTPAAEAPAPGTGVAKTSPDGRRLVQIGGYDADAYLYDNTAKPAAFMKFLGKGVQQVRFSGGTSGQPLEILLQFLDGTFALYDGEGNAKDAAAASSSATAEPPADVPDSIPPPPTAAPGQ